jgi:hypothetical protein
MAKMTEPVSEQLHITTLRTLDDHPLVLPVATAHHQLQDEQRRLTAELVETRKVIFAAESDAPDPLVLPKVLRQARQRAAQLEEALEDMRVTLCASTEVLEAARSEARAALRPGVRKEAVQLITSVLEAAAILLATQTPLQDLDRCAKRLGISLAFGPCYDVLLVHRLKQMQQVLARLED